MSKFQVILLIVFGAFILLAVILFSQSRGSSSASANLEVWGTLSSYDFNNLITSAGLAQNDVMNFTYVEKSLDKLSTDFTKTLAEGKGPDLIILPLENLLLEKNKLMRIPNEVIRPADFVSTFVKEGELFRDASGTYALPMYVDPMVLYWNRDLFAKAVLSTPPVYWDQIYSYIEKLTVKDNAGNITTSAIALGEARNIPHAKEILSLLMLQAGSPITSYVGTELRSALFENNNAPQVPAMAALEFYTQFANPQKSFYTWNRSLTTADTSFTSGKTAMYLGFASELPTLRAKNPTLDIGITSVPQSRASGRAATFGRLYGVAVARSAEDPAAAISGALSLVSKESATALTSAVSLVPARRDVLSNPPTDPAGFTFYGAALQATGWLDPDAKETKKVFVEMIESVTSGRARVDQAVGTANTALNGLIQIR